VNSVIKINDANPADLSVFSNFHSLYCSARLVLMSANSFEKKKVESLNEVKTGKSGAFTVGLHRSNCCLLEYVDGKWGVGGNICKHIYLLMKYSTHRRSPLKMQALYSLLVYLHLRPTAIFASSVTLANKVAMANVSLIYGDLTFFY
jgi:hypothetical protein